MSATFSGFRKNNYIDKQANRFENGSEKKQSLNMILEKSAHTKRRR